MIFLRAEGLQFTIIKLVFISFFISCTNKLMKNELVFEDCKITYKRELYTGQYELIKGDNRVLGVVRNGELILEEEFRQKKLLMKKKFTDCNKGYQKYFNPDGTPLSEGKFENSKRIGLWKTYIDDRIYTKEY